MNRRRARTDIWGYLGGLFSSITFRRACSVLLCPLLSPLPLLPPFPLSIVDLTPVLPSHPSDHQFSSLANPLPGCSSSVSASGEAWRKRDGFRDTVESFPSRFLPFVIVRRKMCEFFLFVCFTFFSSFLL